jgi:hypothetical protein
MKTIEVIIATDGQVRVKTKGFAGPTCREASAPLEHALGLRASEQLTSEFHHQSATASIQETQSS